eukprot:TRINITY_DN12135_c0_g1_i1.p1 TRINITY_DN12135_c0_g1~~TRINITY_DN12135_c0_g1_i1.p1  ORF type:complete len:572 (+),score=105.33 TRINITY_DN12135_c0_g1_i1:73-1788(+)
MDVPDLPEVSLDLKGVDPLFLAAAAAPLLLRVLSLVKIRRGRRGGPPSASTSTSSNRGATPPPSPKAKKQIWGKLWVLLALAAGGIGVGICVVYKGLVETLLGVGLLFVGSRFTGNPNILKDVLIAIVTMLFLVVLTLLPVDHSDVIVSTLPNTNTPRSIADAIALSRDGATIRILPGTYNETVHLSKSVIFTGLGVSPSDVTITGDLYLTADTKVHNIKVAGNLIIGPAFLGGSIVDSELGGVKYHGAHPFMEYAVERCKIDGIEQPATRYEGKAEVVDGAVRKILEENTSQWVKVVVMGLQWVDTSAHWMVIGAGWVRYLWVEYGEDMVYTTWGYIYMAVSFVLEKAMSLLCGMINTDSVCPGNLDPTLHRVGQVFYEYITHFVMLALSLIVSLLLDTIPSWTYFILQVYLSGSQYTQLLIHVANFLLTVFILYSGDVSQLVNGKKMQILMNVSTQLHKLIPVGVEYLFSFFVVFSSWMVLPFLLPFLDYYVTLCVVHIFLPVQSTYTLLKRVDSGKHRESRSWWAFLLILRGFILIYPGQTVLFVTGFYMLFRNKEVEGSEVAEKKTQ